MAKTHRQNPAVASDADLTAVLPEALMLDIIAKLDLESLCSLAPVSKVLRFLASHALSTLKTLDFSDFAPDFVILNRVLDGNRVLRSLTLDCSKLDGSAIEVFAKESIEELTLLRCTKFSSTVFAIVGERCPRLRMLAVEIGYSCDPDSTTLSNAMADMLSRCPVMESLSIKFLVECPGFIDDGSAQLFVSKPMKSLLLKPISHNQAQLLILNISTNRGSDASSAAAVHSSLSTPSISYGLQSLSLALDRITDSIIFCITSNLHDLVELCLEDESMDEPSSLDNDLSNSGLQSLGTCSYLTKLSLTRHRKSSLTTFRRVNDVGMFLLAEGCKRLESARFGGFSKVTDAGYASIIHSCRNLRSFEVVNASLLTDLAFHDLSGAPGTLTEVRLISCNNITSDTAKSLLVCKNLEVLDLSGCKSIADHGLNSITKHFTITTLDLGGADITDTGLSAIGCGNSPITSLCLRGCKRVTDHGIAKMLSGNSIISKSLLTLDLGYLPGVSDRAITAVADSCKEITNLCIRNCFFITDASIVALGSPKRSEGKRSLRMLDLYNCCGLSAGSFEFLNHPFFCGLRWLGVGKTRLLARGIEKFMELTRHKPGLTLCDCGCEMGCKDGWQYHE